MSSRTFIGFRNRYCWMESHHLYFLGQFCCSILGQFGRFVVSICSQPNRFTFTVYGWTKTVLCLKLTSDLWWTSRPPLNVFKYVEPSLSLMKELLTLTSRFFPAKFNLAKHSCPIMSWRVLLVMQALPTLQSILLCLQQVIVPWEDCSATAGQGGFGYLLDLSSLPGAYLTIVERPLDTRASATFTP